MKRFAIGSLTIIAVLIVLVINMYFEGSIDYLFNEINEINIQHKRLIIISMAVGFICASILFALIGYFVEKEK